MKLSTALSALAPSSAAKRGVLAGLLIAAIAAGSVLVSGQPFGANLIEAVSPLPAGSGAIYIPNYTASPGDEGLLSIKTRADLDEFDSITFTLGYEPANALVIGQSPLVFLGGDSLAGGTEFGDPNLSPVAFQMLSVPEPGKLVATVILNKKITVSGTLPLDETTHPTLFKIRTKIEPALPNGEVITFAVQDFAMLSGVSVVEGVEMAAGDITLGGSDSLKLLNAESIDANHIVLRFSDLLSNVGNAGAFDIYPDGDISDPALAVSAVESGPVYGYDQSTLVLTTADQDPGQEYTVTVGAPVEGNTEGGIDPSFSNAVFYGFGDSSASLTDFGMVSASVSGYSTLALDFSHAVKAASVSKSDFSLEEIGGLAIPVTNVSSVAGSQVTLTVGGNLLSSKNYRLKTAAKTDILRDSDSAVLGINEVAFSGQKNGPRILSATVTQVLGQYKAQIVFDENIQLGGVAQNPVGRLYDTGQGGGVLINDAQLGTYSQSISGSTLTLTHADFGSANSHFSFSVSTGDWLKNSVGAGIDPGYGTVGFWGYGHNNNQNTVGTLSVTKKDVLELAAGNLDFAQVLLADVSVLYDDGNPAMAEETVDTVALVGGKLQVTLADPLDPHTHYSLRIVDNSVDDNTLAVKPFVLDHSLSLLSVAPVNASQVDLVFSEAIDERDVGAADFSVKLGNVVVVVSSIAIQPDYKTVRLTLAAPMTPGSIYTAQAISDVYGYTGKAIGKAAAAFGGYQTQVGQSPVMLQSATPTSQTSVRFVFSQEIAPGSLTPVNFSMFSFPNPADPEIRAALGAIQITQVNASTYDIKTGVQAAGTNYFVVFNGVKDKDEFLLKNLHPLNFFGFSVPVPLVTLISPSKVGNDAIHQIVLSGQNLDVIQSAKAEAQSLGIVSKTATSLTLSVPAGLNPGAYSLKLLDQYGQTTTLQGALLVEEIKGALVVASASSQAIPLNVPNNGQTPTTLWVLVQDPVDVANVSSVMVDLTQVGGPASKAMNKDTGPQPVGGQWYTLTLTVPSTVSTKDTPYLLPVRVKKAADIYEGTVSVKVTKDIFQSVAPVINHIYSSPLSVPPDGKTKVRISAQITDVDGVQTLSSVIADLGAFGLGFVPLKPVGEVTEGQEMTTRFYQSDEFTVPLTVPVGNYNLSVTASDATGENTVSSVSISVSGSLTGPKIDKEISYISPRQSIPNDGQTTFSLHAYVTDVDGITDISGVTAYFGAIGLPPATLSKAPDTAAGAKAAWYTAQGLVVPTTAPVGGHKIEIRTSDQQGGMDNALISIDVTNKDTLGEPPRIVEDRGYTTPRIAINDGQTPITLYAFVRDDDKDIQSVVVNLSQIGQVGPQAQGFAQAGAPSAPSAAPAFSESCPAGSTVMVCMQPTLKEGDAGQWFVLPNVTVSTHTLPSSQPYLVDVVATDKLGKTTQGSLAVFVGDSAALAQSQTPPRIATAVSTTQTTVEVVFSKEIAASSISSSGAQFRITGRESISDVLPIVGATVSATGRIVTLTTEPQVSGKPYILTAEGGLRDVVGMQLVPGSENRVGFPGFKFLGKPPIVEYTSSTGPDSVEVEFRSALRPSSVKLGGPDYNAKVFEADSNRPLKVLGIDFLAPNIIRIDTEAQKNGQRYRVQLDRFASHDGTENPSLGSAFKGFNLTLSQSIQRAGLADLNGDGRVDFLDFTIFSSVYGTAYGTAGSSSSAQSILLGAGSSSASASSSGPLSSSFSAISPQPLAPAPDALVPITQPAP